MLHQAPGIAISLLCAVLYSTGIALQALEARAIPHGNRVQLGLLALLARRRRWLAGLALASAASGLQVLALTFTSLVAVQAVLALGLLLLLAIGARHLGERVGPVEVGAVVALVGGVVLAVYGSPDPSSALQGTGQTTGVIGGLSVAALLACRLRGGPRLLGPALAGSAGLALAASNLAVNVLSVGLEHGQAPVLAAAAVGVTVPAVIGIHSKMSSLQRWPATRVMPIVFVVQTVGPMLLLPLILQVRWATLAAGGALLGAGMFAVAVATAILARTRAVSALAHGDAVAG